MRQMQDSSRNSARIQSSYRAGGHGTSVAANVAAGRNTKVKQRFQPTVDDISRALRDRPYLLAQICAVRDDATLDKGQRLTEIGKIISECEAPIPVSDFDRMQSEYKPSKERMAGRRTAAGSYSAYLKATGLNKPTPAPTEPASPLFQEHGGEELGMMLQYVDLIDARYLIMLHEANGNLPCWGAIPASAKINKANMWRLTGWQARGCLGVVALSYPWLDLAHPDANGETLARIVPVLRCMLPLCGGDQFTIGVLIDYASLPQPTRTHAELTRFKLGMRALTMWYAHPYVPVLLVTGDLPQDEGYTNCTRKVEERGWCDYERRLACLCKSRSCLWGVVGLVPMELAKLDDDRRRFDLIRSQLMAAAKPDPPLSPSSFAIMMQKKVKDGRLSFSNKADQKTVIDMYAAGFIKIFEVYQRLDPVHGVLSTYSGHRWEEEQARQLAACLEFAAQKCKLQATSGPVAIDCQGNAFNDHSRRLVKQAIQFGKIFAGVKF